MSLVLANIDADFQITYVFNGSENVGSTETILSRTQMSQNVDFRSFSFARILSFPTVRWGAPIGRLDKRNQCFLDNKTQPFSNYSFPTHAGIVRNTILLEKPTKY